MFFRPAGEFQPWPPTPASGWTFDAKISIDRSPKSTGLCASFSSALLESQYLGKAINAVDYAFQNILTMLDRSRKRPGYCIEKNRTFIQTFTDYVRQINGQVPENLVEMDEARLSQVKRWLDNFCGQRLPEPNLQWTSINLRTTDVDIPNYKMSSAIEMGEEIDRQLDAGYFLSYTYGFHTVTIVGRTKDCRYIIQDSIPESAWSKNGGFPVSAAEDRSKITFEGEFFQYWPRAILIKNVGRIEYLGH